MSGRNIVLLSDGTGNSSGKITKTNIWRLYQAIDLDRGDQLAFYDDGVGTEGFKLLRYLGGGFGYGMARNARQLFELLCRYYGGSEDKILLFGFSRGAFTIRVVSGLIQYCGVIDRNKDRRIRVWSWSKFRPVELSLDSEEGLRAAVRLAYRAFRRKGRNPPVQWFFRVIRDWVAYDLLKLTDHRGFRKRFSVSPRPTIAFLGVFETVSAYGLPIDEMAIAIDRWIGRLRFPDMILSAKVKIARHALALDEARHAFHPMLWTEKFKSRYADGWTIDERPHQVWFAGMHADVGGGYGDDRLSYIPLLWMMGHATEGAGLRLREVDRLLYQENMSAGAPIHDSRRGLASFYRYRPRTYAQLHCQDIDGNKNYEVIVTTFDIDRSVFERIRESGADYAPIGIPEDYNVISWERDQNGQFREKIETAQQANVESEFERRRRVRTLEGVLDLIFYRQVLYYVMVAIAGALVAVPLLWLPNPSLVTAGIAHTAVGALMSLLDYAPVPMASQIGAFWKQHPYAFLALAAGFGAAYAASSGLGRGVQGIAQKAWLHLAQDDATRRKADEQWKLEQSAGSVRSSWSWIKYWRNIRGAIHRIWTKRLMPLLMVLLLFVAIPALVGWRYFLFTPFSGASVCSVLHKDEPAMKPKPFGVGLQFETRNPCLNTGLELVQGREYVIEVVVNREWLDSSFVASPLGLSGKKLVGKARATMSWRDWALMHSASFARRFWTENWFVLMGSIGRAREHAFPIEAVADAGNPRKWKYRLYAWKSGRLYLFVNDAISAFGRSKHCPPEGAEHKSSGGARSKHQKIENGLCFYANNGGDAMVTVTEALER